MQSFFSWFLIAGLSSLSCNSSLNQKNEQITSKKFCLDVEKTQKINGIKLGAGSLTLNEDKTYIIVNDSSRFSNITGIWDIWHQGPPGKNYSLKPTNHIKQIFDTERMEIKVNGVIYTLLFTTCK